GGGFTSRVHAILQFDEGPAPDLFAGGTFTESLGSPGNRVARWSRGDWSPLGRGLGGSVFDLEVHGDGAASALYATGPFTRAGEVLDANAIARWDGSAWSALGTGLVNEAPPHHRNGAALAVFDEGAGPMLYVGGSFTHAGGVPATNIARWDGASWSPVGEGIGGTPGIRALAVFDDGSGPALYAGGYIVGRVMRWDGEAWEDVGVPGVGNIEAFAVFDDGTGPGLYAGGQFAGGIARWDGVEWSSLGSGVDAYVRSLHVFDDGSGPALY